MAWRDAVLVKLAAAGVTGSTWCVLDDLLSSTSARVLINGNLSKPWTECAGVRQSSVLGPLLFNTLFDGIAAAVRAGCPGVALGNLRSPSLSDHKLSHASGQCHPGLGFCTRIHCSRLPASLVREWALARCGHHPFLDGRAARHRALYQPCFYGTDDWSLCHDLRRCPIFSSLRSTWLQRPHSLGTCGVDRLADDMFLRLIFSTCVFCCGHLPSASMPPIGDVSSWIMLVFYSPSCGRGFVGRLPGIVTNPILEDITNKHEPSRKSA